MTDRPALAPVASWLITSDLHVPHQDPRFWRGLLRLCEDVKFDGHLDLGDFAELESCSSHAGPSYALLEEECESAREAASEIYSTAGLRGGRKVRLLGNHEGRLVKWVAEYAPKLKGSINLVAKMTPEKVPGPQVEWVSERAQPFRLQKMKAIHGHQLPSPGRDPARKLADVYGASGFLVVCGHFHRPGFHVRAMDGGNTTAMVLGCGAGLRPGYLHGKEAGWAHGIAVVDFLPGGVPIPHPIVASGGRFTYAGKTYP
jgi:hypothetical protein